MYHTDLRRATGGRARAALPAALHHQAKTENGKTMSVDSPRNTLAEATTFLAWAVTKRWARTNARKWMAAEMEMAETDDRAVAALTERHHARAEPSPSLGNRARCGNSKRGSRG